MKTIEVSFESEILANLAVMAHEKDMKLNDFLVEALKDGLKKLEKMTPEEQKDYFDRIRDEERK